jgi:hypothetical protein
MEHRRLTLVRGEQPPQVAFRGRRVALPPGYLALTDTDTGALALDFSLTLLTGLAAAGRKLAVVFTAFERTPTLEPVAAGRFEACTLQVMCRALSPDDGAASTLREELAGAHAPWLVVGEPALVAFDAPLRILLRGDRPPQAWSPGLRGARSSLSLEAWGARSGVAEQLARLLATTPTP